MLNVLAVEDEPRLRELLVDVIPDMGFRATAVRSAEDALRSLSAEGQSFDVMILDLHLPAMHGMDLFERVRARWPDMQVIILTGFGDLSAAQRAIRLNVVEFLEKPFHLNDVERALNEARRRREIATSPVARASKMTSTGSSMATSQRPSQPLPLPSSTSNDSRPRSLAAVEYREILAALDRNGGNRSAAAEELGISRRTLHYRLAHYRRFGAPHDA